MYWSFVDGFDDFKKQLVDEIGFRRMLKPPLLQNLNLKFSACTMNMVDVDRCAICISKTRLSSFGQRMFIRCLVYHAATEM
jgi:hypothetical protein